MTPLGHTREARGTRLEGAALERVEEARLHQQVLPRHGRHLPRNQVIYLQPAPPPQIMCSGPEEISITHFQESVQEEEAPWLIRPAGRCRALIVWG